MNQNCNPDCSVCLFDLLNSEKFLAGVYNENLLESATPEVSSCLFGILEDEHRMAKELFEELSSRGLYPTEKAPEDKITQTKLKYSQKVTV